MLILKPPAEVGGNVWMLGTTPYPVYLVRGEQEGAIIEGGISALGPVLEQQLAELGVGPDYVKQAVITHAHPDHVMAIPRLRQLFPGLSVVASATAATALGMERAVTFFRLIDGNLTDSLYNAGTIPEIPPPPPMTENRIAVDHTVAEGETITLAGRSWTVLATPGHSDCSISLHEPATGVLAISDASGYYLPATNAWWPNYFVSYPIYMQSLERLAGLDAEVLCLSHNAAIRGRDEIRAYFAGAIAATRDYHQRIVAETQAGKPLRQLSEELGEEIYRQAPLLPLDFFQKNCGLLVKQSLKHAGVSPA
jgi:glyoxylase-like metal-dependent hydrolase (beta-lactamase superfamily II)